MVIVTVLVFTIVCLALIIVLQQYAIVRQQHELIEKEAIIIREMSRFDNFFENSVSLDVKDKLGENKDGID